LAKVTLRWLALVIFNSLAWAIIAGLWVNFLWAPWPVSWNLAWDFLFTRTGGPLLYANHVSSAVVILGVVTYFGLKNREHIASMSMIILSTVAIHEFILEIVTLPVTHFFFFLNLRWIFWLSLVLGSALILSDRQGKIRMGKIALVVFVYMVVWDLIIWTTGLDYRTVVVFAPGPAFFNPWDNIIEIVSWILPMSMWFWV
jgi:hypothetical protein